MNKKDENKYVNSEEIRHSNTFNGKIYMILNVYSRLIHDTEDEKKLSIYRERINVLKKKLKRFRA